MGRRDRAMNHRTYFICALLVMAGITYLIRALPLLFVRKRIENQFFRSFLYYVPYAVLSALAFPAIFFAAQSLVTGVAAAVVCFVLAYKGKGVIGCMLGSVVTAFVIEELLILLA